MARSLAAPALLLALCCLASGALADDDFAVPDASGRAAADVWSLPQAELEDVVHALALYAGEKDGAPVVAVNLVFLGQREQIRGALRWAGWYEVGHSVVGDFEQGLGEVAHRQPLEHFPPFTVFYLRGKPQELNEERATSWTSRHHFRIWPQAARDSEGRQVWAAAGDYDEGVRWSHIDHVADPNIDKERDFIAATLRACPYVERLSLVLQPGLPASSFEGKRHFRTDRRVLVVELKPGAPDAPLPPGLR